PDLAGLGWAALRQWPPAMDAAPEPYSVWADCSPVLAREKWPAGSAPRGVFYFCGPWKNDLTAQPSTHSEVPALALQQVASGAVNWPKRSGGYMCPLAKAPANPAGLDWAVLHAPENRHGVERMAAQYLRPNVDPTECCETSLPNTTRLRLKADESGFENLVL